MMTYAYSRFRPMLAVLVFFLAWPTAPAYAQDPVAITVDGGRYFGPLLGGKLHGRGRIVWDNGDSYEGDFRDGLYSGVGTRIWAEGDVYEGEFRRGRMSGRGQAVYRNGSVYVGEFSDDRFNGHGRYEIAGGEIYEGEFKDSEFHGVGRYENKSGEVYEGDFELGVFTGTGTYTNTEGSSYSGGFRDWLMHGEGRYTDDVGNIYEGNFEEGQMEGEGTYTGVGGMQYEGQFSQWQFSGHGRLRQANGDEYVGEFAGGYYNGEGTLTYANVQEDGRTHDSGTWFWGSLEGEKDEALASRNVETALYNQRRLLDEAISSLEPGNPETIDLYLLAIAGDGSQEVFRREVEFVKDQFLRRFGTEGRTLTLVNSRTTVETLPMATTTSIEESIQAISQKMNRDQDILFLFMTSHGSQDHQFALGQKSMALPALPASRLGEMLSDSNIRWKVVVVSACYAGGFIEPIQDSRTLIIAAARHDRRSFGCADEDDFTYFGRAYFKDALPDSNSFQEAFVKAKKLVRERELTDQQTGGEINEEEFSLPQIDDSELIAKHLQRWWANQSANALQ